MNINLLRNYCSVFQMNSPQKGQVHKEFNQGEEMDYYHFQNVFLLVQF